MISMRGLTLHAIHIMKCVIITWIIAATTTMLVLQLPFKGFTIEEQNIYSSLSLANLSKSKFEKFETSLSLDTVLVNLSMWAHWEPYQIQN